jgi:hypothetical protein
MLNSFVISIEGFESAKGPPTYLPSFTSVAIFGV